MARNFKELESKMSATSIRRSDEKARTLKKEMALNELRAAMDITQEHLAGVLGVNQAAISKLERRTDMYVSTLGSIVRAMGGELELNARFPEGTVRIKTFGAIKSRGIGSPEGRVRIAKAARKRGASYRAMKAE
jgi:transcriptional regulator with XRE-family HTH domain